MYSQWRTPSDFEDSYKPRAPCAFIVLQISVHFAYYRETLNLSLVWFLWSFLTNAPFFISTFCLYSFSVIFFLDSFLSVCDTFFPSLSLSCFLFFFLFYFCPLVLSYFLSFFSSFSCLIFSFLSLTLFLSFFFSFLLSLFLSFERESLSEMASSQTQEMVFFQGIDLDSWLVSHSLGSKCSYQLSCSSSSSSMSPSSSSSSLCNYLFQISHVFSW